MEEVVQLAYSRAARAVTPTTEGLPAAQAGLDSTGTPQNPTGAGLFEISDTFNTQLSVAAGVTRTVLVVPYAHGGTKTWTMTVYGMRLMGTVWRALPLFQASCVCDVTLTGDTDAYITNSDKMASAITPTITYSAGAAEVTSYASTSYPAHALVNTRGCPFLIITGSDAAGRVVIANVS